MSQIEDGERIEIELRDIPQSLMDTVQEGLSPFLACMAIIDRYKTPIAVGSGTFVKLNDRPCILTAAHVWRRIEKAGGMLFSFGQAAEGFSIDAKVINAHSFGDGSEREWGPDLALLELPPPEAGIIASKRIFLNLGMQAEINEHAPTPAETDLLIVCGNVATMSRLEQQGKIATLNMHGEALFSVAADIHHRDGLDFIDVGVNHDVKGVPEKFGGVSGGPLWTVTIAKSRKTGAFTWDGRRRLIGVAYWESAREEARRIVRCHGPASLYDTALKDWTASVASGRVTAPV